MKIWAILYCQYVIEISELRTFLPLEVLANQIELMEDASLCREATKACKILENYYSELEEFEQLGDILKIR